MTSVAGTFSANGANHTLIMLPFVFVVGTHDFRERTFVFGINVMIAVDIISGVDGGHHVAAGRGGNDANSGRALS